MKLLALIAAVTALLSSGPDADAESPQPLPKADETYELVRSYETSERTSDGSSGSASGRDAIIERVVAVRDGGVELEYDLPPDATGQDRARDWHFPARVFKPSNGPMQLLNRGELEARLETWLEAAELTRAACGRWIFTWNAFLIDCDPDTVLETLPGFDPGSADLRDGTAYQDPEARGPGTLTRIADGPDGARLRVVLDVDPDSVRRARAESDVAVGQIMRRPVTLDAALREHADESVSGTITITFEIGADGRPWRRTRETRTEIGEPGGVSETQVSIETAERRRVE